MLLCSNFVFVEIGGEYPFWELAFWNWKLDAVEIVDENHCVKLTGFLFPIVLCSACLIFCASSESLAIGSCSYLCTIDHPAGDRSANLISLFIFFSFVSIDVKLADSSSILRLFNIWCWHSFMARNFCVEIKLVFITIPFYLVSVWFFIFRRRSFHVFVYLACVPFFVGIVERQI